MIHNGHVRSIDSEVLAPPEVSPNDGGRFKAALVSAAFRHLFGCHIYPIDHLIHTSDHSPGHKQEQPKKTRTLVTYEY